MLKQKVEFNKNKLAIAVSLAILSGVMGGCSSSSSTAAAVPEVGTNAPVAPKVLVNGGSGGIGEDSNGGDGGGLYVNNEGGTGGVDVLTTGAANTAFTTPAAINSASADLGDNPLNITADTTLVAVTNYNALVDATLEAANTVYVGTDNVLRTSGANSDTAGVSYTSDLVIDDGRFYTVSNANELYQAVGGDAVADLAVAGIAYQQIDNTTSIYLSDADAGMTDSAFSGISVAAGATLALADNYYECSNVSVPNDIDNNGTITRESDSSCSLSLNADSYFGNGAIVNAGTAVSVSGGEVYINASTGIKNNGLINASGFNDTADGNGGYGGEISMNADGYILNNGLLNVSGGDGAGTSGAGGVDMYAAYTENNGDIDASGGSDTRGAADATSGGQGGYVSINAGYVSNNTAKLDVSGGTGSTGGGGGEVDMSNDYAGGGEVKNSANLNLAGGTGIAGDGGYGGEFDLSSSNAHALSSGDIDVSGGDTTASGPYNGGGGGNINVTTGYDNDNQENGDAIVSGNLNAAGGNAPADSEGNGGDGGYVDVENNHPRYMQTESVARVALLGYSLINANGGDATHGGDSDDESSIRTEYGRNYNSTYGYSVGSVVNEVPIDANGGNTTATGTLTGSGGDAAGYLGIYTPSSYQESGAVVATATNTAAINLNGGNAFGDTTSDMYAGSGGYFEMESYGVVENSGVLTANGGNGGQYGGSGGDFYGYSDQGVINNTGDMSANGGNGASYGGDAGTLEMYAYPSTNAANLSVNGGNATDAIDSQGGDGGYIEVGNGFTSTNAGALVYAQGTGEVDGNEGCATVGIFKEGSCND